MPDRRSGTAPGTVLRSGGGTYQILLDDQTPIEATLRGRLKSSHAMRSRRTNGDAAILTGERVVAGDRVIVAPQRDGSYTIESIEPRTTELARRAPGRGGHQAKVLVANVDQVVTVFAAAMPTPRLRMLDRFLVLAESNHLPATIIINKTDLISDDEVSALFAPYERAGYPVLRTSVVAKIGLDAVRSTLCHRESVLTGPSGVGKSSLLNAIEPGLGLRVGEVSAAVQKGRHTTVTALLVPLGCGGFVADTPGLRELGLWGIDPDELDECFPEFRPFLDQCRFGHSCSHTHEPECAICDAVEAGRIDRARYESYVAMRGEA